MTHNTTNNKYFEYLCDYAGAVSSLSEKSYYGLLEVLYSRQFYWSIPMDANRNEDGLNFRNEIIKNESKNWSSEEQKSLYFSSEENCTVLEMLLKLAHRCEVDIMGEPQNYDKTREWFWMFIKNLGLERYSDDLSSDDISKINEILNTFLDRSYDKFGNGGLFPLRKNDEKDQREVEIWYQMNSYLMENFD